MSQENVEFVRRLFEAFNRQDASAVAELWTPDGDWRPAYIGGGQLEGAVFRGPEGMAEFVEVQSETWESVHAEPVKMRDLGDTVLVEVHLSAVGRGSGVPVDVVTWNVFEVLDGRLTSGTAYTSKEKALKAVGLEESAVSQENVEVVRRSIEAFQHGRFDSAVELWDPEGEWIPAMAGAVEDRVYRGHAALRRYFEELFASFSEVHMHDVAFRDLGNRVLVLYRLSVRGRESGVAIDQQGGTVHELRGGKIVHGRSYLSHGEALKALERE